jgi:hypothetical protein
MYLILKPSPRIERGGLLRASPALHLFYEEVEMVFQAGKAGCRQVVWKLNNHIIFITIGSAVPRKYGIIGRSI